MRKRNLLTLLSMTFLPIFLYGQSISGIIDDGDAPLAGANVVVEGTELGAVSSDDGSYRVEVAPGTYTITTSFIGHSPASEEVVVGEENVGINFTLVMDVLAMSSLEVLASRADEKTPVAYSMVSKEEMEVRLGSQDIPMILNTTPSVYATNQGGGAGDARINVRGFNQRNVAVMINGVPQNDMENGWVYWSNWDGIGDATSSIQMQRGLSAVNLATPSIGGTMNIITDPAAHEKGGKVKQEAGAGGFLKTSMNYNSGLMMGDKLALSGTIVRKTGNGIIDKTWTDAWAYYIGASYQMNKKNRFELYTIGAPQRHGQNLYKQNVMAYDQEFAKEAADYDALSSADSDDDGTSDWDEYVAKFTNESGEDAGRLFNQNWSPVDPSYTGKQYWYMYGDKTTDRYNPNFLNERENFFHKPLVNLNHFLKINDNARLSSILYWSGGSGGGTGTYGKIPTLDVDGNLGGEDYKFYYGGSPWTRDWNTLIAYNSGDMDTVYVDKKALAREAGQSVGILRNSINRQNTIGAISKLNYVVSDELELQVGIDWRTAKIEHAREVRDLLGGEYYVDYADDNSPDGKQVGLGDIIAYHNHTTVDWLGGFLQGNYQTDKLNIFGMGGVSMIDYSYQDHFTVADEVIEADAIMTFQAKGGVMFDLDDMTSAYVNAGYVEKPPIMDNVIYNDGTVASNPANEKFISTEAGVNWKKSDLIAMKAGFYHTYWKDRNLTKSVTTGQGDSGDTDVIFLSGVDQRHAGVEFEASIKPHEMVRLDLAASLGDWKFAGDAAGNYQENEYNDEGQVIGLKTTEYNYALDKLKVGDMPQTSFVGALTLTPVKGLKVQALYNWYNNNFADWSPTSREYSGDDTDADREQVWMAPSYSKVDFHASYALPEVAGFQPKIFAHVFNALDETYVQDAVDHSQYNSWGDKVHAAQNAEVFLGTPRYYNVGLSVNF